MSTEHFKKAWEELSPIQREAASWDEGSLLVLAGPGSGKTRVLTCRIARILDSTHDKNFRIMALTFTNKAADEMRSRVANFVPGQEGRLFLGTFHSFCADVLRQHGTHLGINPNFNIYSLDVDLQAILSKAAMEAKRNYGVENDLGKNTLPVIHRLKSRLILPENSREAFQDKDLGERVAIIYRAYEEELAKRNALDFDSLIFKVYQLFTKYPAIAKRYRTVYPYICMDEFQDTNHSQYSLIGALTGDNHKNLFIVADDDQIIYQWNGASYKRIEESLKDYSPKIIQLPMNYRCPPEIVKLANNLIRHNFLRTANKKPLEAFRPSSGEGTIRLFPAFPSLDAEVAGVVKDIKGLHSGDLGSVAILGRSRRLLDGAEKALRNEGLPAIILQRKDNFESTPFKWLHSILSLANDRQSQSNLEAICGTFDQLTQIKVDPEDVITQARISNNDYLQQWIKNAHQKATSDTAKGVIDQISCYLGEGRDFIMFTRFALDWFSGLVSAHQKASSDMTAEVFTCYDEELSVWRKLMREITRLLGDGLTLEAFLQELQMRSKEPIPNKNKVVLMTIHGAKGKEFDHVYIIGLADDELPSFQSRRAGDGSPEMEEERRNCFVAITRTIKTLTLSYAKEYGGWQKEPSRFLFEMGLLCNKT